jgi:hAT family C-terminal dimerisation region/Domain of unknown function (DUF4413)
MSGSSYPTLCASLQQYALVLKHIEKMSQVQEVQDIPLLKAAVERCRAKLLKFFDKSTYESEYYFFATVLDPRYKLSIFESYPDLFSTEWVTDCKRALITTLTNEYDTKEEISITGSNVPSKRPAIDLDDWEREMQAMLPEDDAIGVSVEEECATYLAEARNKMEPLDWWRINTGRFPRLSKMARDFLAIPGGCSFIHLYYLTYLLGSSVSVERSFNCGRDIISIRRHSLSSETLRSLMVSRSILTLQKKVSSPHTNSNKRRRLN